MKEFNSFYEGLKYVIKNKIETTHDSEYSLLLVRSKTNKYDYRYVVTKDDEESVEKSYNIISYLAYKKISIKDIEIQNLSQLRERFREIAGFDFYSEYVIESASFDTLERVVSNIKENGYNYALYKLLLEEDNIYELDEELYITSKI